MTFLFRSGRARQFIQIVWVAEDSYAAPGLVTEEEGMIFGKFWMTVRGIIIPYIN